MNIDRVPAGTALKVRSIIPRLITFRLPQHELRRLDPFFLSLEDRVTPFVRSMDVGASANAPSVIE